MAPSGIRLAAAVSGGADSVCLLELLLQAGFRPVVAHLNHRLRGAESDSDEQFVAEMAARHGLTFVSRGVDLPAGGNLEQNARDARRAFFLTLIRDGTVDRIALAHTRDDQAETVLFRLLRGAYSTGLSGMRPVTGAGFIRPMLDLSRAEIEGWLREKGIAWREDSSNRDLRFARNRIRHELLPQLREQWNAALPELLANHAKLAQDDEEYWESVLPTPCPILTISELPEAVALRRRIIRNTIRHVKGDLREIDYRHVGQVLELAADAEGHGRLQIPGVDVMRSFDWLRFAPPPSGPVERDWSVPAHVPGVFAVPPGDMEIVLHVTDSSESRDTLVTEALDLDLVLSRGAGGLQIRNWRPGDRYQRAGYHSEEKIKSMFQEARIPLWERRNWPVICLGEGIVWSRRFGPAQAFVANGTRPALRIFETKRICRGAGSVSKE